MKKYFNRIYIMIEEIESKDIDSKGTHNKIVVTVIVIVSLLLSPFLFIVFYGVIFIFYFSGIIPQSQFLMTFMDAPVNFVLWLADYFGIKSMERLVGLYLEFLIYISELIKAFG